MLADASAGCVWTNCCSEGRAVAKARRHGFVDQAGNCGIRNQHTSSNLVCLDFLCVARVSALSSAAIVMICGDDNLVLVHIRPRVPVVFLHSQPLVLLAPVLPQCQLPLGVPCFVCHSTEHIIAALVAHTPCFSQTSRCTGLHKFAVGGVGKEALPLVGVAVCWATTLFLHAVRPHHVCITLDCPA